MKTLTFKKGIYQPHHKYTEHNETIVLPTDNEFVYIFPMSQHIGAPCKPLVEVGDRVLVGQKIGDTDAFLSSPIHATISGVVEKIAPSLMANGQFSESVYVKSDGLMEEDPSINKPCDYQNMSREEILNVIHQAGVVGIGGAGFPTHVKLNPPPENREKVDTVIINAAECEPYLTTDHRIMLEETERILLGLMVILSLFPGSKGVIGVETNKMDAIHALEALCQNEPYKGLISVAHLLPKYPQGAERQLIYAITGREVPSGGLPFDAGCIVNNADTTIAIHRALFRGRPLMRKIITVSGGAAAKPGNYKVRLGLRYEDMMELIGGFKETPHKMIAGGPMMGNAMYSLDVPLTKVSSGFLVLTEKESGVFTEHNCIRCGKCVDACPANLMPLELNQFVTTNQIERFEKEHGKDCIECGCCSYVCPANRHLVQSIRVGKGQLMALNTKKG